jgi:hypothetical protein
MREKQPGGGFRKTGGGRRCIYLMELEKAGKPGRNEERTCLNKVVRSHVCRRLRERSDEAEVGAALYSRHVHNVESLTMIALPF